jgi:hypothetical protein
MPRFTVDVNQLGSRFEAYQRRRHPSTDHLLTFAMRHTLPLAVVVIVAALLFIRWRLSL